MIMGFDTSGPWVHAALIRGETPLAQIDKPMAKGQAEALMPALQSLLTQAGAGWSDLSAIGVGIGPGNFTGIRISVAAARGLALGLGIPAIGVDRFDAARLDAVAPFAAVPALRGQFWVQQAGHPPVLSAALPSDAITDDTAPTALAVAIARIASARRHAPQPRPAPLYLRPADATPSTQPVPLMLD